MITKSNAPSEAQELLAAAEEARNSAYAPYSRFAVGAAVRTGSGRIVRGANIENASFSLTVCAERVALFTALASGETVVSDIALTADQPHPLAPCGACRQVMAELAPSARVWMANASGLVLESTVEALLPNSFAFVSQQTSGGSL